MLLSCRLPLSRLSVLFATLSLLLTQPALACAPCERAGAWLTAFDAFELSAGAPGATDPARWRGRYSEANDIAVDVLSGPGLAEGGGKLLLVGGRVLAIKGLPVTPGAEIDALDAPALNLRLAATLLAVAFPQGLAALRPQNEIRIENGSEEVLVATPSAEGVFPGPWSLDGTVLKPSEGRLDIDLVFRSRPEAGKETDPRTSFAIHIAGRLEQRGAFRIDDATPLAGWSIFRVGVNIQQAGGATSLDYGAKPASDRYATVADIRAVLAQQDYPGEPDDTLDFSGAWKTNCSWGHGLRIRKDPQTKMYSVVFCGPGGCVNARDGRPTFIKKAPGYEVVSPVLLRIHGEEHHRCGSGDEWPD